MKRKWQGDVKNSSTCLEKIPLRTRGATPGGQVEAVLSERVGPGGRQPLFPSQRKITSL